MAKIKSKLYHKIKKKVGQFNYLIYKIENDKTIVKKYGENW